jgi:hypothetical protein
LNKQLRSAGITFVFAAVLSAAAAAGETQASVNVGGANSCSSEGFNDPGLLGGPFQSFGTTLESLPAFTIEVIRPRTSSPGLVGSASTKSLAKTYFVQVLMWNPEVFPGNPNQWSNGLVVTVWPNGSATSASYGTANGIAVTSDTISGPNGGTFLKFPFEIDGL